jgi:hypothetical protein
MSDEIYFVEPPDLSDVAEAISSIERAMIKAFGLPPRLEDGNRPRR